MKKKKKKSEFDIKKELKKKSRSEFSRVNTSEKVIDQKGYKRHPKHKVDY